MTVNAAIDLSTMVLDGRTESGIYADVRKALLDLKMTETISGAPTMTMDLTDPDRTLLKSGLFSKRVAARIDNAPFDLVGVSKSGDGLTLTFEDSAVVALRDNTTPRKAAAKTMTRVAFCTALIREEGWIKVHTPRLAQPPTRSLVELARGGQSGERESTWEAIGRILGDIGWRAFARRGSIWLYPDSYLLKAAPFEWAERTGGIDDIDFDFDEGQTAATATVQIRTAFRQVSPGDPVRLLDQGPASSGLWLVSTIERSPFTPAATVTLIRSQPVLKEPKPQGALDGETGFGGYEAGSVGTTGGARKSANAKIEKMLSWAQTQKGKPYQWGGKSGKPGWDCSGLASAAIKKAGVSLTGGSKAMFNRCQSAGTLISVSQAANTRGALLFRMTGNPTHVALSLGNGSTIEAVGRQYGVANMKADGSRFTHGALIPGVRY